MKQLIDKRNGMQFYTISEISEKIQMDIAYLRENLEIVSEEYEHNLVKDLEMFLLDGIAREIRLSIYDPLQNNMVFVEYSYSCYPQCIEYGESQNYYRNHWIDCGGLSLGDQNRQYSQGKSEKKTS